MLSFPAAKLLGAEAEEAEVAPDAVDDLLEAGRQLWEQHAPAEIREQYAFPDGRDVREFLKSLDADLREGSLERLSSYEPDARRALALLRLTEEGQGVADWLEPRLDFLSAAHELLEAPPPTPVAPDQTRAPPTRPGEPPKAGPPVSPGARGTRRPQYTREYWERIVVQRPPPARAHEFVPRLKDVFRAAGIAPALVWLAEVESSMNPRATSPAGARGLFQLMPATAERFGLRVSFPDERTDPDKSARAAAAYLRFLHERFGSWPLALAAYNAGEGRVGKLLAGASSQSFDAIVERLPAETRLYVPKVLATVAVRESVDPEALPPPTLVSAASPPPDNVTIAPQILLAAGATQVAR